MVDVQPFNQPPPQLGNQYEEDTLLRGYLERVFDAKTLAAIEPDLRTLGDLAVEFAALSMQTRLEMPALTQWSAWGERIDHIELTEVWKQAEPVAAKYGLVAAGYDKKLGPLARVHQFVSTYLFTPSTDTYGCPLAMTDGATATLLASGNQELIDRAVPRLTSRDPATFWTSGQWMTESTGGSDVGLTETVAVHEEGDVYRLYGRKWFTSAATSQIALTLARPEGNPPGGHGLALFYLETRDDEGQLRDIRVHRLKDKLGTRKLPTAELFLDGARARLVTGNTTGGVRDITPMLNVTRTWNAVTAVAGMRRGLALARDFATRRVAFGAPLSEKPLHVDTLAAMQAELEGAFQLAFYVVELLGASEHEVLDAPGRDLLRLLTPIAKLTTAKQAVALASEVLEAFGGAGYVEDTGLPALLRDAQVLSIWEGTTNVLSLDVLRAIGRGVDLGAVRSRVLGWCDVEDVGLQNAGEQAMRGFDAALAWLEAAQKRGNDEVEAGARRFALTLGRVFELALLVRHAQVRLKAGDRRPRAACVRFAQTPIDQILWIDREDAALLAGG